MSITDNALRLIGLVVFLTACIAMVITILRSHIPRKRAKPPIAGPDGTVPVVLMKFGSVLYGTDTPASDKDYKGIFIPAGKDILLQRAPKHTREYTNDTQGKNTKDDVDIDMYSLSYFMHLAAEGQTVALDMLFAPEDMIVYKTPMWDEIVNNRHRLLHKNIKSFTGYCRKQAAKYGIKGSRISIIKECMETVDPYTQLGQHMWQFIKELPDHPEYVRRYHDDKCKLQVYEICGRKFQETISASEMYDCLQKILNNYGERAKQAAANEGIDWKAVSHAFRVCYEVLELLKYGKITFPLKQADNLKDIKLGKLHYKNDSVEEKLEELMEEVEEAVKVSTLPEQADEEWIDDFVSAVYMEHIRSYKNVKVY